MYPRVTQRSMQVATLAQLNKSLSTYQDLQSKAAGGKNVTRPSDDPALVNSAMITRSNISKNTQHLRNANDGLSWLNTIDGALQTTVSSLQRARDLAVSGANTATMNPEAREAIALELEGIRDSILQQANTRYLDRNLFAGSATTVGAFTNNGAGSYSYNGISGSTVTRRVSDAVNVRVDEDGAHVFGTSADPTSDDYSVFNMIDDFIATLRSADPAVNNPREYIGHVDNRLDKILTTLSGVGARSRQVENSISNAGTRSVTLAENLSDVEDIDIAATVIALSNHEVAYNLALKVASNSKMPTLMDYL